MQSLRCHYKEPKIQWKDRFVLSQGAEIMDIDKWEALKEEIGRKFEVLETKTEDLSVHTQDGEVKNGKADVLILETPMGKIKLAFEERPVVTDKKFIYSHRAGQAARTEYEYSDTEKSYKLRAYKWNDDNEEWKEIDAGSFAH